MKISGHILLLAALLFQSSGLVCAQDAARKPATAFGGLVTLYRLDPALGSFCFTENHAGGITSNFRALANGGEIDFGAYRASSFSVAVSNGSTGRIVDLGTSETLKEKYHYPETVGGGQGFASIHRKGASFLIKQRHGGDDGSDYQELAEGGQLLTNLRSLDTAPVILGHIYLLHVVHSADQATDVFVKLLVVAYYPDQSVTIRWEMMAPE